MRVLIPLSFLALPILEIAVFILVGNAIGLLPTLALIFASIILGVILLRQVGLSTFRALQAETRAGRDPAREIVQGAMMVVSALLLIVPGFITDGIAILLLLPPVRAALWRAVRGSVVVTGERSTLWRRQPSGPRQDAPASRPIEVVDLSGEDFARKPSADSPWRDGGDERN